MISGKKIKAIAKAFQKTEALERKYDKEILGFAARNIGYWNSASKENIKRLFRKRERASKSMKKLMKRIFS